MILLLRPALVEVRFEVGAVSGGVFYECARTGLGMGVASCRVSLEQPPTAAGRRRVEPHVLLSLSNGL